MFLEHYSRAVNVSFSDKEKAFAYLQWTTSCHMFHVSWSVTSLWWRRNNVAAHLEMKLHLPHRVHHSLDRTIAKHKPQPTNPSLTQLFHMVLNRTSIAECI